MGTKSNMSYREVIPRNINPEEWIEVEINTGALCVTICQLSLLVRCKANDKCMFFLNKTGTQSTLQDIKTFGKSGSYCYNCVTNGQNRNRFIYW